MKFIDKKIAEFLFAILLSLLFFTGCKREENRETVEKVYEAAEGVEINPAADTVKVILSEWKIEMPSSLTEGDYFFAVTNNGTTGHNFKIVGEGIDKEFDSNLKAGETRIMENVKLAPGKYKVYCPVNNHESKGMRLDLNINAK